MGELSKCDISEAGCKPRATLTAYVVTDVRIIAEGLVWQIDRDGIMLPLGSGLPSAQTLSIIADCSPSVVILDLSCEGNITFAPLLATSGIDTKLIGIASGKSIISYLEWARLGVVGFVDNDGSSRCLAETASTVLSGGFFGSPHMVAKLVSQCVDMPVSPCSSNSDLTRRETQILAQLEIGASNKEIARALGISVATVKNHVHNLLEKLHITRRSQAIMAVRGLNQSRVGQMSKSPPVIDALARSALA
jgi:two-component system, NarL family, nitrate/nitrite response regulator NarL